MATYLAGDFDEFAPSHRTSGLCRVRPRYGSAGQRRDDHRCIDRSCIDAARDGFYRVAERTIDGSGFSKGAGFHSTTPGDVGIPSTMWLSNGFFGVPADPFPVFIAFDLGANYDLNSFEVRNYNENTGAGGNLSLRGANDVEVLVADSVGGVFTSLGLFTFDQAPGMRSSISVRSST